jgi:predicted MFS family arabinose efflux permease
MMTNPGALWADRDFVRLWAAQAVSAFGSRITRDGLPLAAVLTLRATPLQIGLLAALSYGPALVVGLAAGGHVDRTRRRALMIRMDLLRAGALATVPLAAWLHLLSMSQLYLAAAVVGAASVLFELADHAYLPGLVAKEHITSANSSLSATESVAEVAGPAVAGVLFQWLAGPFAIALNAVTYLLSAGFLVRIRRAEPAPDFAARGSWLQDIRDGWRSAVGEPRVASLLFMTGSNALFGAFFAALYVLFAVRVLGLTPAMLGLTIAAGGVGGVIGAVAASWLAGRLGQGRAIVAAAGSAAMLNLLIPAAPSHPHVGMAFLVAAQLFGDALAVAAAVLAASLRQSVLPQGVLGRVGATFHAVAGGMAVIGALAGGMLGGAIGPRAALYVAALGLLVGPAVAALSGLTQDSQLPKP